VQIINELSSAISSEKSNVSQLEKRSRDMQLRLENILKVEEDLKKCSVTLGDLDELIHNRDGLSRQIKDLSDNSVKFQSSLRDKENRLEQVNRQLSSAHEKLTKLHSQQQGKREQVQLRLKELRDEYGQLSEERSKVMLKIDQSEKMIKEVEVKVIYGFKL
jgi:kinetochore protein Nuf2